MSGKKLAVSGVLIALLAFLPLVVPRNDILTVMFTLFLFLTLGQTWNIISGFTGQLNLGHAGFFGLGALTTRLLWLSGVPLLAAMLLGGLIALAVALIIGAPVFRLRGVYFICSTLAAAEIMRITVGNVLPRISSLPPQALVSYELAPRYWLALALAVGTVAVAYFLSRSKAGLAMVAIREDPDTAQASGVNILKYKLMAWGISSFIVGLAGGLFAYFHVSFYFDHAFFPTWSLNSVYLTIIGGVGTVIGPVVGAVFFVLLNEVLARVVPPEMAVIVFGIIFLLVIMYMPRGLVDVPRLIGRLMAGLKKTNATSAKTE